MPIRTPLLYGLFLLATLAGCTQKVIVQLYPGSRLPAAEVALIRADLSASQELAGIIIRRVNGVDTLRTATPHIEVLPGPQTLRVELYKRATRNDAIADARAIHTLSFEALPGRVYQVRGKMLEGVGHVWIVDDANTYQAPARQQAESYLP